MKIIVFAIASIIIVVITLFSFGPFEKQAKKYKINPKNAKNIDNTDISKLDDILQQNEAKIGNVKKGAQKQIIWYNNIIQKTPYSIVYIHGFSASLGEIRPLPDLIAKSIGANLFYTRLAGHGRENDGDMKYASARKWYKDIDEAIAIGNKIGEKTIIMGTSTGGTLATIAVAQNEVADNLAAVVLFSPNYDLKVSGAAQLLPYVLNMPFGRNIVEAIRGETFNYEPHSPEHQKWWSLKYPTHTVLTMQAVVEKMKKIDVRQIKIPALFIYHKQDGIVDPQVIAEIAEKWGGEKTIINPEESNHESNHIVAGDVFAPQNTQKLHNEIVKWIRK